jgi:hypothetical protein
MEEWKTIENFENYQFSSENRVRNKETGTFLKLTINNCFSLYKDGKKTNIALSKLKQKYFPVEIEYLPEEIFLIINDYPDYEISNKGRVYSKYINDFLTPQIGVTGYYKVILSKNGKQKNFKIHRLVATAFIPNPKNLPEVDHIDRNKLNNNISNLRCVSNRENCNNKIYRPKQTNKYNLTDEIKKEIITKFNTGEWTSYSINKKFGIPSNYICMVKKRGTWNKLLNDGKSI